MLNRRKMIRGIGSAICAGIIPPFIPSLLNSPINTGFTKAQVFRLVDYIYEDLNKKRFKRQLKIYSDEQLEKMCNVYKSKS